jgi:hypothetical protein
MVVGVGIIELWLVVDEEAGSPTGSSSGLQHDHHSAMSRSSGMRESRRQQGCDGVGGEGSQGGARTAPKRRAAGVGRWRPDKPPATD